MPREFWHSQEVLTTQELAQLQIERLTATVEVAYSSTRFYKKLFDKHKVSPGQLKTLSDLKSFPFTYPRDLRKRPLDFRVASVDVTSIHCSGGTVGQPKIVFRTYRDHIQSSEILARLFYTNGVRKGDVVAILQPFGLWAIGFLAFEGLKRLNATALPIGIHMDDRDVIELLRKYKATGLFITPSNCLRLTDLIQGQGLDPKEDFRLNIITLAGEKVTAKHRHSLSEIWGADVFSLYGSEETDGLATECCYHTGLHFAGDQFYLEIINPDAEECIESASIGEAVITTLTKEGTPLIRYRIGDIVRLLPKKCKCGRTLSSIEIKGRTSEVLVLTEGTKVYPFQVDAVLEHLEIDIPNYQVVRTKDDRGRDILSFTIEVHPTVRTSNLTEKIADALKRLSIDFTDACNANLVDVIVCIADPNTIQPTARGKVVRFINKLKG